MHANIFVCASWMATSANSSRLWQRFVGLLQLIQMWPEGSYLPHPWMTTTSLWSFQIQSLSVAVFFPSHLFKPSWQKMSHRETVLSATLSEVFSFFNVVLMTPLGDF